MPSFKTEIEWFDVNEKLPTIGKEYLTVDEHGVIEKCMFHQQIYPDIVPPYWNTPYGRAVFKITHWAYIPDIKDIK